MPGEEMINDAPSPDTSEGVETSQRLEPTRRQLADAINAEIEHPLAHGLSVCDFIEVPDEIAAMGAAERNATDAGGQWTDAFMTAIFRAFALPPPAVMDRETGGRIVREAWIRWALTQPDPKPSWLVPYDGLSEPDKEADRQIAEAVASALTPASGWTDTGQWVWVPRRIPDDILKEVGPMDGFEAGHPKADDCHRKWWSDVISAAPPRQWTDEDARRALEAYLAYRLRHSPADPLKAMRAALSTLGGVGT